MTSLLIKNGRVIDPANRIDAKTDIFIENGKIATIENSNLSAEKIIDATGMWVLPGFIDMHVHLRDPGQLHKETLRTGTQAAAAGGFTTVCCMPNTSPTIDSAEIVKYIKSSAEKELVNVIPIGSITKGLEGEELSDISEMKLSGICAISDDGKTVSNAALFKLAMEKAKGLDMPVLAHCEDLSLTGDGQINAGAHAMELNLKGIPAESEEIIIARDIILARETGARLHICHVSTRGGIELIRAAKKAGQNVTCEVTPHHFTLVDEDIVSCDANFKMSPPLRSRADRAAIIAALCDGTIDAIATDHAPHSEDEKKDFTAAPNGIIGLETAVPLAISELIEKGILTPSQLVEKFALNPSKILGLNAGSLEIGKAADITIINPKENYSIDKNNFKSLSRNTPFHGRNATGRVVFTIVSGKIAYELPNI